MGKFRGLIVPLLVAAALLSGKLVATFVPTWFPPALEFRATLQLLTFAIVMLVVVPIAVLRTAPGKRELLAILPIVAFGIAADLLNRSRWFIHYYIEILATTFALSATLLVLWSSYVERRDKQPVDDPLLLRKNETPGPR